MSRNSVFTKVLPALVVLLSLLLSACTPSLQERDAPLAPEGAEDAASADASQTITVWHGWDGIYLEAYAALAQDYSLAHDDVAITLAKVDELSDALAVSIPAKEGPDIMQWVQDQIGRNALVGNIVPLDAWIDTAYLDAHFEPAAAQAMVWNNQIWGVPESQEGIALVFNRALVTEEDLPAPGDFEALYQKAAAFRQAHPDKYYLCNQGLGNSDAYHVAPIYFGHGMDKYGGFIDEQGKAYLDTPEALDAARWIAKFRAAAPAETSHEICQTMLVEGRAAMWWTGPWAIADLEAAGVDYGIAPMGSPFVGIKLFMLTSNAVERGHGDAAIDVMRYFGSEEVQARLSQVNKTIPANTAALHDEAIQALYTVAHFGEALNLGIAMPNHPYIDCQWDPVGDATTAIWNGAQSPEEAMRDAQAAIEQCIAEMR